MDDPVCGTGAGAGAGGGVDAVGGGVAGDAGLAGNSDTVLMSDVDFFNSISRAAESCKGSSKVPRLVEEAGLVWMIPSSATARSGEATDRAADW